jgi:hypothetical protein
MLALCPLPCAAEERVDFHGDALPDAAVSRLGSLRFRQQGGEGLTTLLVDGRFLVASAPGLNYYEAKTGNREAPSIGPHAAIFLV